MTSLETIEGIGPTYAERLRSAGIGTVEALLRSGSTPEGRRELEERTGIGHEFIVDWVNRADLMRIRGVGEAYSNLVEKAGVDTVTELARCDPDNLYERLLQVNAQKLLVRRPPSRAMVARWVEQAKALSRVVSY